MSDEQMDRLWTALERARGALIDQKPVEAYTEIEEALDVYDELEAADE